MEAAAGRGGSLPIQSSRKEWRAVAEHSVRSSGNEELDRVKLGQSDERTIYEVQQGTGPLDAVDFSPITMDDSLNTDPLQQRLHSVSRQREKLQQIETELRAQVIARSEIMEMQSRFDTQIKEHANAVANLKDQLQEREQSIQSLEIKMEEKDRELRAIKIDNEAAWAKEDLLREQNKELATFRRERDNSEAERAQHLKQIHELTEHIQEKERQFLELEEQHRVAQDTILYKDEQLREAQAWIARIQEMDALQSNTNHSLQAELRERTDQFNQFWIGCQRQFADMERHHMHAIQQLQLELAEARKQSGIYTDDTQMIHANSKDASPYVQNKESQVNTGEDGVLSDNPGILPNGNIDSAPLPFVTTGNAMTKADHVAGVPVPSSILGIGAFLPPGQVPAVHPFVMHQQGVPHSVPPANSNIPQSHLGHFQPVPAISSHQHWQNPQVVSENTQIPNQSQYQPSQTDQNLLRSDAQYDYELSAHGQVLHSDYLESHIGTKQGSGPVITTSSEEPQVLESNDQQYLVSQQLEHNLQESSSHFHEIQRLDLTEQKIEPQGHDEKTVAAINHKSREVLGLTTEEPLSSTSVALSAIPSHPLSSLEAPVHNADGVILPEVTVSAGCSSSSLAMGKSLEATLLDERALLACIVRAIPAGSGGQIRISTTLPNRLGKMLAPLHWHDYRKKYGKLDDFVGGHPELFVIEGDFIHLRDGAQEIISATTAVAKVAAAAAASAPYSSLLPSVAVTPMAQTHRLKKVPSIDTKSVKTICPEAAVAVPADAGDKPLHLSAMKNQHLNGVCFNIVQGLSNVKILSKSKDLQELNGFSTELKPGHSPLHVTFGNGTNPDGTGLVASQNKGSSNGRHGINSGAKQQGRATRSGLASRR